MGAVLLDEFDSVERLLPQCGGGARRLSSRKETHPAVRWQFILALEGMEVDLDPFDAHALSLARSNALQAILRARFERGEGPLAALPGKSRHNPGLPGHPPRLRTVGPFDESLSRVGYSIAGDITPIGGAPNSTSDPKRLYVRKHMAAWGLYPSIWTKETWHFVPMRDWNPTIPQIAAYYSLRLAGLRDCPAPTETWDNFTTEMLPWFRDIAQLGHTGDFSQEDVDALLFVEEYLGRL